MAWVSVHGDFTFPHQPGQQRGASVLAGGPWLAPHLLNLIDTVISAITAVLTAYVIQIIRGLDKEVDRGGE